MGVLDRFSIIVLFEILYVVLFLISFIEKNGLVKFRVLIGMGYVFLMVLFR